MKASVGEGQATLDRDARRQIQSALAAQGFDPGQPDGVFGPRTRGAIEAWQQASGYAATGELTSKQAERLLAEETPVAPTGPAASGDLYGSIAFSQLTGGGYAFGIAWNEQGREAVRRSALEECRRQGGGDGCHEAGWFQNGCGAIAIGDGNGYGTGSGETSESAESGALSNCRSANRDCRVEVSRCMGGDYRRSSPETALETEKTLESSAVSSVGDPDTERGLRFFCKIIDGRDGYGYLKWKSQTSINQEYDASILRSLAFCQLSEQYNEVEVGLENLRKASRMGDVVASQMLGAYYLSGGVVQRPIPVDVQESIRWYEDVLDKISRIPDYPNMNLTSLAHNEIHFLIYPDTLLQLVSLTTWPYEYESGFCQYNEKPPSEREFSDIQRIVRRNLALLDQMDAPLSRCLTDRSALQFEARARDLGVKESALREI